MRCFSQLTLLAVSSLFITGCATKNPAWLESPVSAHCAGGVEIGCLQDLAVQSYSNVTSTAARSMASFERNKAGQNAPQKSDDDFSVTAEPAQPEVIDEYDHSSIARLGFALGLIGASAIPGDGYESPATVDEHIEAGKILHPVSSISLASVMKSSQAINDEALRGETISTALVLLSKSESAAEVDRALNVLHELDIRAYEKSLFVKLPALLAAGDLERARALQALLLKNPASSADKFSMLGYLVACYTMAGLESDAIDLVRRYSHKVGELSNDDIELIKLAKTVGSGAYPLPQDFYGFESDEARLSAYLTIAIAANKLGGAGITNRAVSDAVRFMQKAGFKGDRDRSLARILSVAPLALPAVIHE